MFRKKKTPTNCDVKLIQLNLLWRDNWILFSHLIGTDCSFAPSNPTITAPRTFRPTRTTLYYIPYICIYVHIYVWVPIRSMYICRSVYSNIVVNGSRVRTLAPFSFRLSILGNDRISQLVQKQKRNCQNAWRFCPLDRFPFRFGNDLRWMLDVRHNKKNDSILNDFLHSMF